MSTEASLPKRQAFGKQPNYVYSVISVALVLFLLGLFGILIQHAQELVRIYKESVNILVEIKPETSGIEQEELKKEIRQLDFVKKGSMIFTSKEAALEDLQQDLGEAFSKLNFQNPLYDVISFNLNAGDMAPQSMPQIRAQLMEKAAVHDVFFQEDVIGDVEQNIQLLSWLVLGVGGLLTFVAVVLIYNTIRLALFANRFIIKNMQLVGASWGFISRPFLMRSLFNGLLSAILAILALLALLFLGQQQFPDLQRLQNREQMMILFGGLVLLGLLITFSSTYFVVKKYLKMRVDDLY